MEIENRTDSKELTEEAGKRQERNLDNKRIVLYLLITFGLTYALEIFGIMPRVASTDINQAMLAQSLTAGVMFIPAIGALLTRMITKERFTPKNLYVALNLKGNVKYYALAWFGFAGLIIIGTALYFLIFREQFDPEFSYVKAMLSAQTPDVSYTADQLRQLMVSQILMGIVLSPFLNIFTCFGEEWGWRGYLLPKMLKRFSVVPTLLINGVIWGLWHAPLTMMGHNYGIGYPGFPYLGIFSMCIFCIVIGIILSYITIKTKSCIPAILAHGTLNGFAAIGVYFTSLEHPYNVFLGPMPVGLIGGAGFILTAAALLFLLYREEKQKKERFCL